MGDAGLAHSTVEPEPVVPDGETRRRGRGAIAAVLLLLLLLCTITTIGESWLKLGEEREVRGVLRNLRCLQCHVELIPDFSRTAVHDPFRDELCTTCHTPHGEIHTLTVYQRAAQAWDRFRTLVEWLPLKIVLDVFHSGDSAPSEAEGERVKSRTSTEVVERESHLVAPADQLCWMCHGNLGPLLSWEYPHAPFKAGHCTACHDPHASDFSGLLVVDHRDLCVACHPVGAEMARSDLHPPFEQRECISCHHPHSSRFKGVLVDNQRDLCFSCHPTVARLTMMAVQHDPFQFDNCTGCHEPHASNYRPLVVEAQPELCYACHPQIRNDFLKVSHHPVGTLLDCTGCHQPHASDYPAMLPAKGNAICYTCHDVIRPQYVRSGHRDAFCWGCHQPHGSDFGPLLNDRQPELCFPCHERRHYDDKSGGYWNHPVRPVYWDVNKRKPLTCTTTCHDPHGTAHTYMLRLYDSPLDGNCLICHAVVEGDKVGVDY